MEQKQKHFLLVHGACHGAWSWHKLKPRLESAGHHVTALDLAASGINRRRLDDLRSLNDYTTPLMDTMASIPAGEKVILVGHSLGGFNLALAMEKYPEKISAAVFLAAFMPDSLNGPSYVLNKYVEKTPPEAWLDTEFSPFGSPNEPLTSMFFGPKFLAIKLYQLCSTEDLELAKALIRPSSLFREDLAKGNVKLSEEGYGSVKRVYVVCAEDQAITEGFQHWMVENSPVDEVKEIKAADHMAMLSKPDDLCLCLLEIADKIQLDWFSTNLEHGQVSPQRDNVVNVFRNPS